MRFFLGLLALIAAAGFSAAEGKDGDAVRAKRHTQLAETYADLTEFCSSVRGWKVADSGTASAAVAVVSDPNASEETRLAAEKRLREADADISDLSEAKKQQVRLDVQTVKENCGRIEDADTGLPVLSRDGAKLEKIGKEKWDALTDKLGAVALSFKGKNAFGDSADQNYGNCYEQDCLSKGGRQFAKLQMANDAAVQFTTDFENVLPNAIADASSSK